ncbi:MAG TPA: hypothetical protein VJN43_19225 [Bryobacteraceae bacterium]|nr:hypothetical protein [Bryobacteraceae bacterium]
MLNRVYRTALMVLALACAALASDISGTWEFTVDTAQGSGSPSFTFKQDGEKLTGTYSGMFGKADLSGTVKGDKVEFSFEAGNVGKASYRGTLESPTRMKGECEYGDVGKGTFTATKK